VAALVRDGEEGLGLLRAPGLHLPGPFLGLRHEVGHVARDEPQPHGLLERLREVQVAQVDGAHAAAGRQLVAVELLQHVGSQPLHGDGAQGGDDVLGDGLLVVVSLRLASTTTALIDGSPARSYQRCQG
jgi:hypothetical protein